MKKYIRWLIAAISVLLVVGAVLLLVPAINGNKSPADTPHTHSWSNATCAKPKTCKTCGATEGEAEGHTWNNGKCTECGAFKPSEGLSFILGDGNYYIVTGIGSCKDAHIIIPNVYKGFPVTAIGESAFNSCEGLTNVTVPDSIKSIGAYAFASCTNLESITLGSGVTAVGEDMFINCANLIGIWVSERNVAYTSDEKGVLFNKDKTVLFKAPGKLKGAYTVPQGVTAIGAWAFYCCDGLTDITIPGSVQSIGMQAFLNCDGLTSITIPEGVITIDSAFDACSNLTSITIPDSVTSLGNSPFYGCPNLTGIWVGEGNAVYSSDEKGVLFNKDKTELIKMPCGFKGAYTVPDSVKSFSDAFLACRSLTSITIPDGVNTIADTQFASCESLVSVIIPDSVEYIGSFAFYSCRKLESITIPKSVKILSSSAFAHCYGLKSVTIPDGVKSIHDRVFESCTGLKSITIPDSVTEIYYYAFDNCKNLTSITYTGTKAQWQNIKLWYDWNTDVPATEVVCSDGTVSLSN